MADRNQAKNQRIETTDQVPEVKIVAEMPEDPEIREHLGRGLYFHYM